MIRVKVKLIITAAVFLCVVSCGGARQVSSSSTSVSKIEVRDYYEFVPFIVQVDIPEIKETIRTRDTSSHLENKFSYSDAIVHSDGTLEHTLGNFPQTIERPVDIPVHKRDSIVYEYRDSVVYLPGEVVEKKLNWWQRVRLDGFYILLLLLAIAYRKPIFKAIKRLFII